MPAPKSYWLDYLCSKSLFKFKNLYNEVKSISSWLTTCFGQIHNLIRQLSLLSVSDENLTEEIDFCVSFFSKIDQIYNVADITTKQQILGSVFPEKLYFEERDRCKTRTLFFINILQQNFKSIGSHISISQ